MSHLPRRARQQQRALYTRTPDPTLRINDPDGYPSAFTPIPTPASSSDITGLIGPWWFNTDAYRSRTTGSPLTEPSRAAPDLSQASIMPAITRCLGILTEAVVRTRWLFQGPDGEPIPRPLWVHDPMLQGRAPGPIFPITPSGRRMDGHSFFGTVLADAIMWGRGAFTFIEASDGTPLPGSLILLNPLMIDIPRDGHVVLDAWGENPLRTDFNGRFELGGDTWRVAVLPGQYPNHAGLPQGVLLRHFDTFRLGARLTGYLDSLFTSGVPSGYLTVSTPHFGMEQVPDPDNPDQLIGEEELLKRQWMRAHGTGRRSVAVLNSSVAYSPIAIKPVDAEVVGVAAATRTDVAHAFGMSSIWLDEGVKGMSYSNSSERRADLVSMTAAGWGEKLTMLIASLLPYGTDVSVNWLSFIAPSTETMMPSIVQGVQAGVMAPTEGRQLLGWVPWTGPDRRFERYLQTVEYGKSDVSGATQQDEQNPGGEPQ